jgi:hypothetical protein
MRMRRRRLHKAKRLLARSGGLLHCGARCLLLLRCRLLRRRHRLLRRLGVRKADADTGRSS